MNQQLYEERLPKKYNWTKKDFKEVKDCIRLNQELGPMVNDIFANAFYLRAKQKQKQVEGRN